MRILLTGATGFLGAYLATQLVQAGHTVDTLSRQGDRALRLVPDLSHATAWAPTEGPPALEALEGVDAVVHLAGEGLVGRWTERKKRAIRESRVTGTRNLVTAMASVDPRPRTLVSMSATGYYGDEGEALLTEDSPPGRGFLADMVTAWEREAARAEGLGVRVVVLRTGIVLGRGGALRRLLPAARLGLGGPMGSGRQWWSWVHIRDFAGLVMLAVDTDLSGPILVASPAPVRQRDLARTLGSLLHRPAWTPAPAWALRLALGEVSSELLWSRRVSPRRAHERGYDFLFPELEPALRDLLRPRGD